MSENVRLLKLDMKNFVAGELKILTSKLSRAEYKGRMSLLKKFCVLLKYTVYMIQMSHNQFRTKKKKKKKKKHSVVV